MKKVKHYLFAFAIAVICMAGFSVTAHAATLVSLKAGTTYKCDLNADSSADTIKWNMTNTSDGGKGLNIYINGKRRITMEGYGFSTVWYYRTSAANEYLLVQRRFIGGATEYDVFHCKSTGIVKLGILPSAYFCGSLVAVNGEIRYATCPKYEFGSCYLGRLKCCVRVKIANGKMSYVSRYAKCYGNYTTYTASNSFYLLTGAGHKTSNGVLVKAGYKVKFQYAYFRNNEIYYRVVVNGKAGWLPETARLY